MNQKTLPALPCPVLIGLMGCGKSSIGRRLATRLNMPLIDLDELIVERASMSIPDIFDRFGEEHFRHMENKALASTIGKQAILATGGGIVLREDNRRLLGEHPPVIWLKASPKFLAARIEGDRNRPLIAGQNALPKLNTLAAERYPLYEACADFIVDREGMKKRDMTALIINYLAQRA